MDHCILRDEISSGVGVADEGPRVDAVYAGDSTPI